MTSPAEKDTDRNAQLMRLAERLGVPCNNLTMLDQATTHKSYGSEYGVADYERLEFFGDAVFKFVIAEDLFVRFPDKAEGEMTQICAVLISAKTLEAVGRKFGLQEFILRGRGVPIRPSIIAQSMEAILGAVYMDSKFDHVRNFILQHFSVLADEIAQDSVKANYKALLQEYTQARAQGTPVYSVIKQDGPPHDPIFEVAVFLGEKQLGEGTGSSKKVAQQAAARNAMIKLTGQEDL